MKILFLTHFFYPVIGGIEVNSEILAGAFHDKGHDVHLVTWTPEGGTKIFPFKVIRQPRKQQLISEHKWADLVFENNPSLRLSWPSIFFHKPSVVALRTWIKRPNGKMGWQDKLKLKWLGRATYVIAVSEAIREECWPKAIVIGNPFRTEIFRRIPDMARTSGFVFLGRLVSDKGADIAIKAFERIVYSDFHKDANLTIIGDGPELDKLKKMSADLKLENKVRFLGSLQGEVLVKSLNEHKYMLVPSLWREPFGNVALEGMACGCLPIVSNGGGLPDAVGDAGVVFERGSVDSLVVTITNLLKDSTLEKTLRSKAQAHLANHYPDVVATKYLKVIEAAYKGGYI